MENNKVDGFEKYKKWLKSNDKNHKDTAIHVLHHTDSRDDEIDESLIRIAKTDQDIECRRAAIKFMAETGDIKFKGILIDSLRDEGWKIRGYSYMGLKKMSQDKEIIDALKNFEAHEMHPFCLFCINNE